jgi:Ras homolog enriched in brain
MIQIVYDKIISYCGTNDIPCVIVGSKTDLQTRYVLRMPPILFFNVFPCPYSPIIRQVKPNEGENLAKVNKAAWVETSAKNDFNVGECDFSSYDPAVSHRLSPIVRQGIRAMPS